MGRDWEKAWQDGDTPWDKGAVAPPLLEYLGTWDGGFMQGARVLVPGCGSGHDVRALAGYGAEVLGLDLAPSAVRTAQAATPVGPETYVVGDFLRADCRGFDALWEHTCFCAIDPSQRDDYVRAAATAVRPGGRLVGVFFLNPAHAGEGPPFPCSETEVRDRFEPFFKLVRAAVPTRAFPSREGREWLAWLERRDGGDGVGEAARRS